MLNEPEKNHSVAQDSCGARAAWSPTGIALITVLLSPLPGGILHALNYARLGKPERTRLALASNLVTTTVLFFLAFQAEGSLRVLLPGIALVIAAYFYKSQGNLFRRHRSAGGEKASLLLPGILSVLFPVILALGITYAEDVRIQRGFEEAIRLMEEGKSGEAETKLLAYQSAYPDDMASYWNLALIYEQSGNNERAKQELRAFISRSQNPQEAQKYLDRLESIGR